jgi:D-lactate dehydrogenase (quinone)
MDQIVCDTVYPPVSAASSEAVLDALRDIVGKPYVLTDEGQTRRFRTGYRCGGGSVLAVVRPGSLVEQWRALRICVEAGLIVLFQAANTGLTGGSTPDGDAYDRPIVLFNTMRMRVLHLINDGRQVVCLPGATLDQLEKALKPLGREPHSVIGSSCIGASVFGGICNNSGGALVQRGPAFTQLALYARIDADGALTLVNHLGIRLRGSAEDILARLDRWDISPNDIEYDETRWASDREYTSHVRAIDEDTPARFNADPRRLYEASGCAGKAALFAVRLDTFPAKKRTKVFYIGTNTPDEFTQIRRTILGSFQNLPIAAEYLHRDAFNLAEVYGKDMFLLIDAVGTARLPGIAAFKSRFDVLAERAGFLPPFFSDRALQWLSRFPRQHLPARMLEYRDRFEHHLMLKVADDGIEEIRTFLNRFFTEAGGAYFECTDDEAAKAFLHRFVTAGAAIRYRAVHSREVEDIVALDIALPRNERTWQETLPPELNERVISKIYYGHFLCYVFHQDYIMKKGEDCLEFEHQIWSLLDERGAEYPAEHNVGHLYKAKPALEQFYRALDPCNAFNPGIGQTTKCRHWRLPNQ